MSNYQKSLAVKSIIAQLINSILIPMMANYYIKGQNIFGRNGLTQDILILGLIYSLVAPITKVLDVSLLLN